MENNWQNKVEARLAFLETRNAVDVVHRKNIGARLLAIEDTLKWLVRLMLGGLILSALTYALNGGLTLS